MNDYRFPGNDPNRQRETQSPEEVRRMMAGTGSAAEEELAHELEASRGRERSVEKHELLRLGLMFSPTQCLALAAQATDRCPTCGREFDCCCQGCPVCPQTKMGPGMISAEWARKMNLWSGTDPREDIV